MFSRNKLQKTIKNGAYVINLGEYTNTGTHWVVLYEDNEVIYFDTFGVEHIPKESLLEIKTLKQIYSKYYYYILYK